MNVRIVRYFVNTLAAPDGRREVHANGCRYLGVFGQRLYLGAFASSKAAVTEGRKYYSDVRGCPSCSRACRTA